MALLALAGEDGGDVVGGHAVQVQVNLGGPLDRRPLRRWEGPETAAPGPGEARARPGPVRACR
jgi:hypothetical protein